MLRAMGDGFVPWRCLKVPVELEGTCGANLGWGRAEFKIDGSIGPFGEGAWET